MYGAVKSLFCSLYIVANSFRGRTLFCPVLDCFHVNNGRINHLRAIGIILCLICQQFPDTVMWNIITGQMLKTVSWKSYICICMTFQTLATHFVFSVYSSCDIGHYYWINTSHNHLKFICFLFDIFRIFILFLSRYLSGKNVKSHYYELVVVVVVAATAAVKVSGFLVDLCNRSIS